MVVDLESVLTTILSIGGAVLVAWVTNWLTVKSQQKKIVIADKKSLTEAEIAAEQAEKDRQLQWFNELQEERTALQVTLKEAQEELKRIRALNNEMAAGYRRYIHSLRGQLYDNKIVPLPWPEGLDQ